MTGITQVATTITAPTAPTIDSITSGPGTATIYFSAPASNGSSAISSYTASCSATGQETRTATGPGSPLTVLDLIRGVAYECTVTATNGDGLASSASASMSVTPTPVSGKFPWLMFLPAITRGVK